MGDTPEPGAALLDPLAAAASRHDLEWEMAGTRRDGTTQRWPG